MERTSSGVLGARTVALNRVPDRRFVPLCAVGRERTTTTGPGGVVHAERADRSQHHLGHSDVAAGADDEEGGVDEDVSRVAFDQFGLDIDGTDVDLGEGLVEPALGRSAQRGLIRAEVDLQLVVVRAHPCVDGPQPTTTGAGLAERPPQRFLARGGGIHADHHGVPALVHPCILGPFDIVVQSPARLGRRSNVTIDPRNRGRSSS
jgi:hypothetical protein